MKQFHVLTLPKLKQLTLADLEEIREDFGLPMPARGKKVLKKDYVNLIGNYIVSNEYAEHSFQYANFRYRYYADIPSMYRTRDLRRATGLLSEMDPRDITFTQCLMSAKTGRDVAYFPMEKFTLEERASLIRESPTTTILARVATEEVIPWLSRWPLALEYVPHDKQTLAMCQQCVAQTGWALQYCSLSFVSDALEDVALRSTPYAIQWVRSTDRERYHALCRTAVASDAWTIEFMEQTPELRMLALFADWTCHNALSKPLSAAELSFIKEKQVRQEEEQRQTARTNTVYLID